MGPFVKLPKPIPKGSPAKTHFRYLFLSGTPIPGLGVSTNKFNQSRKTPKMCTLSGKKGIFRVEQLVTGAVTIKGQPFNCIYF